MMGSLLGLLCVLSALTATGFSLTCRVCTGTSYSSCSGTTVTCAEGYVCGSIRTTATANGQTVSDTFVMSCVTSSQCDTPGNIRTPNSNIKMGTSCCDTNNCTPSPPTLPSDSSQMTALICRTCISDTSDWCYTADTMQCTENENMCLLQRTVISGSTSQSAAIRGCGTKSFCDLGSQSVSDGTNTVKVSFTCTSGSFGLRSSELFASVLAIAVAKFFYF